MNREEKTQLLGELNELFNSSEIIVVSHYKGLTVKEVSELRDKMIVVGGAMGTGVLSVAEINKLATIPSMDELRAKIIGLLQAPGAQLARVTRAYSEKEAA